MKLLILGATGRTGKWLLQEALLRNHDVQVLVRDRTKIKTTVPNLEIFEGNPADREALRKAAAGCEAVLSALNISRTSDFPWAPLRTPQDFLSTTAGNIVEVCTALSISRVLVTSAWGAAESRKEIGRFNSWFIDHSNLAPAYQDHERQEAIFRSSSLEWTCVRPVILVNSTRLKEVRVSINGKPKPSLFISRRNVARFMLDELIQNKYIHQAPVIFQ